MDQFKLGTNMLAFIQEKLQLLFKQPSNERVLIVRKGSYAICSNNHAVAYIDRDIYRGDTNYSTAFKYLDHQPIPVKGQITDPVCYCGEAWFSVNKQNLITKPITTMREENEKSTG